MNGLATSFNQFFDSAAWGIIKPILLLVLAFVAAAIVKTLVVKLLTKTKMNKLFDKLKEYQQIEIRHLHRQAFLSAGIPAVRPRHFPEPGHGRHLRPHPEPHQHHVVLSA